MRLAVIVIAVLVLVAAAYGADSSYVSVWGAESGAQQATSSWYGNVGLVTTPTAYTPPASATTLGAHWVNRDPEATWVATVNFGLTKDIEVGGSWVEMADDSDAEALVNIKYHLDAARLLGEKSLPDMAIGCADVGDAIDRAIYMVFSKSFVVDDTKADSPRINLHLGWGATESGEGVMDGFFGGVEFQVLKYGLVQAEYDGEAFNADLRYSLTPKLSLDLGVLDGDLGAGATYRASF
jgi:hypothetical protein